MTVTQRAIGDCGCSALATVLNETYEDVYVALSHVDRRWRGKRGLLNTELVRAAMRLGVRLEPTRRYDLASDRGVLRVRWNDPGRRPGGHFVALRDGHIECPAVGTPMPWQRYFLDANVRACTLLRLQ